MGNKDQTYLNDIGKFTSYLLIGETGKHIFLIISSALVTNFFGKAVYGQYAYVMSFISIVLVLASLGLSSGMQFFGQKFIQNNQRFKAKGVVGYVYACKAIFGTVLSVLIMVFARQISSVLLNSAEYAALLRAMAPLILIESLFEHAMSVFRLNKRIARYSLIRFIFYQIIRIAAILTVFFVFEMKNAFGLLVSTYTAYIILLVYSLYLQFSSSEIGKPSVLDSLEKKELVRYSIPLLLSSLISVVLRKTDILMLGHIKDSADVAVYSIAVQVCTIIPFLKRITGAFLGPMVSSQYHSGRKKEVIHTYQILTKWELTFGTMIFLGIILFGDSILHIFGKDFVSGHFALVLVACGYYAKVLAGQSGGILAMTGHPKVNLVTSVAALVVNIGLNLILIPRLGIVGAAIATMVSVIITSAISVIYLYYIQKIHPYTWQYFKPLIAAVISFITIKLLNRIIMWEGFSDVLIKGVIFVIVYSLLIYLLKISQDDRVILNGMISAVIRIFNKDRSNRNKKY